MEKKKDITQEDANNFWGLLDNRHSDIGKKISTRLLQDGNIKPVILPSVNKNEIRIFQRYFENWCSTNGFTKEEPDLVEVVTDNDKIMAVNTREIKGIEPKTLELTKVYTQALGSDAKEMFTIKSNFEDFKKEIYIF